MEKTSIINFGAGPSKLPLEVMVKARDEFLDYNKTGMSIMEVSHRGPDFSKILNRSEEALRRLLSIPRNYKIIFLQGGGTGQFSAVPMNLISRKKGKKANYILTGIWSKKAAKEAEKYGNIRTIEPEPNNTTIPDPETWNIDPEASYVYFCDNDTINGVEFPVDLVYDNIPADVPIVSDMSSNFLSRPFDVSKFGVIFAGAQKNIGCAGVVVVIVREDLLNFALPYTPVTYDYKVQAGSNSMLNTPPTFSIYMMHNVLEWIEKQGGVERMYAESISKSSRLYQYLDGCNGFYRCAVDPRYRSRMNVTFRIADSNEELEKKFLVETDKNGLKQLKGHRFVGGIRVSLYNALVVSDAEILIQFMNKFQIENN